MLKRTITYTDFLGVERTEDLYFHIPRTAILTAKDDVYDEVLDISTQLQESGKILEQMGDEELDLTNLNDPNSRLVSRSLRMVARLLDRMVDLSYGIRTEDGRGFIKNEKVLTEFKQSAAYDAFVEELLSDYDIMIAFLKQLVTVQ